MCERNVPALWAILETALAPWEEKALQRAETAAERFEQQDRCGIGGVE